ncbi:MAG: hypothetical protein EOM84_01060 [Sphingobacteriia bacterium]|jgi:hypothetical protein|nr:hypothetical protein [Sphingobacteriia bacterium]
MRNVSTDSRLINVLVVTLAEFLSKKLKRKVIGNGLGFYSLGPNNITARFRFEGEEENLCSLEYGKLEYGNLQLILSPYLLGINRTVHDELKSIINMDMGIGRPCNPDDD